ncbi:hypothetical protein RFI_16203 [Reticulomyxa filosa]|uniref:Uncharacterized protein n=1 Tax=Reticulomyxa filosa TaxID=46433 RepID=X6N503_RETFI|nr:hypothetical protein RFI_16203 [Reticulomyxa filosa]|eukprot:ETO21003.1 hypothetical protein RFI_16203 [Reticulomyxa filosa]
MWKKKWRMTPSRLLQIVQGEYSNRPLRTFRWLINVIDDIFDCKNKSDESCIREHRELLPLPEFVYHEYIPMKFGVKQLVDQMCWDIHNGVQHYAKPEMEQEVPNYMEIVTFKEFLDDDWVLDDLCFYLLVKLTLLKARQVVLASKLLFEEEIWILFNHIPLLLESIFDGACNEYRHGLALRLQALALYEYKTPKLHRDMFLRWLLDESQQLSQQFDHSCKLLYFHFQLSNFDTVTDQQIRQASQWLLSDRPLESVQALMQDLALPSTELTPFDRFVDTCKSLFKWKQQIKLPKFQSSEGIKENLCVLGIWGGGGNPKKNIVIVDLVSSRWETIKDRVIRPIIELLANSHFDDSDRFELQRMVSQIQDYTHSITAALSLRHGWHAFLLYTEILSAILNGLESFDQAYLKYNVTRQEIETYLLSLEEKL